VLVDPCIGPSDKIPEAEVFLYQIEKALSCGLRSVLRANGAIVFIKSLKNLAAFAGRDNSSRQDPPAPLASNEQSNQIISFAIIAQRAGKFFLLHSPLVAPTSI
jgi:hypothetical protein